MTTFEGQLGFWIRLTEVDQAGTYNWSYDSCIIINEVDQVCKSQDALLIVARNTCPDTQIIPESVIDVISVIQGNTDESFSFFNWEWPDTIGYAEAGQYGVGRCGLKTYEVRDANNNLVDWVTVLPDGTLKV